MTLDNAIALATRLHPSNGILPSPTDVVPTFSEALDLIRKECATCGFTWLTGVSAEEVLQSAITNLNEHFPPKENNVYEERDPAEVRNLLNSKMSCCWGQGPIGTSGYYQLARPSPQSKGNKRLVIIATQAAVDVARNEVPSE